MTKKRTYKSWHAEVKTMVKGLPITEAAKVIERNAIADHEARNISLAVKEAAMRWAFNVSWLERAIY